MPMSLQVSDITRAYYDIGIIELGTNIEAKTGSWALEYTGYNFNDVFLNQNFSIIGYDDHGINSSQYYSAGKVTGVHVMGTIDTPVIPGETRTENSALVINKLYYDWIYDYVDGIL